jgi:hypothetical protein
VDVLAARIDRISSGFWLQYLKESGLYSTDNTNEINVVSEYRDDDDDYYYYDDYDNYDYGGDYGDDDDDDDDDDDNDVSVIALR